MALNIFFAGDVVVTKYRKEKIVTHELESRIKKCDIACCNFEAPLMDKNQIKIPKIGPSLSQDERTAVLLKEAGFNLFSLANNHIMDYGKAGLEKTLNFLNNQEINYIGAGMDKKEIFLPYIIEKDSIKLGIISVAENGFGTSLNLEKPGYAWFGAQEVSKQIEKLKKECTHIIIVCHGGAEKWDIPLPEYRNLYRKWIDMGITAVIAHHPHVPQGWEEYNGGFIFYSLGNFAFDKGKGIQNPNSICVELHIDNHNAVSFDIIQTAFKNNGVDYNTDSQFSKHLNECNIFLDQKCYMELVNKQCLKYYKKQYKGYYGGVLNIYKGSFRMLIKTILYRYIKKEKFSDLWLYHNLEIETHYWICRRALDYLRNGEKN